MRKRFSLRAVCSTDGSSDVYKASRKAHKAHLSTAHEEFVSSDMGKSFMALSAERKEPFPDTMVRVRFFGEEKLMPYSRAKACKFNWSY